MELAAGAGPIRARGRLNISEENFEMQMKMRQWLALAASAPRIESRSFADVDDSSADSFPASDPPSWASMRVGAPSVTPWPTAA